MADDGLETLYKIHRSAYDKYLYFLLAAAGAAIGFALNQTRELALAWSQIPLGIAILCWAISFFTGCLDLMLIQNLLQQNYQLQRAERGLHPDFSSDPAFIKLISSEIEKQSKASAGKQETQFRFLVAGGVFYILWHITEMYLRTS